MIVVYIAISKHHKKHRFIFVFALSPAQVNQRAIKTL